MPAAPAVNIAEQPRDILIIPNLRDNWYTSQFFFGLKSTKCLEYYTKPMREPEIS